MLCYIKHGKQQPIYIIAHYGDIDRRLIISNKELIWEKTPVPILAHV
jgi:hypothetical protein